MLELEPGPLRYLPDHLESGLLNYCHIYHLPDWLEPGPLSYLSDQLGPGLLPYFTRPLEMKPGPLLHLLDRLQPESLLYLSDWLEPGLLNTKAKQKSFDFCYIAKKARVWGQNIFLIILFGNLS